MIFLTNGTTGSFDRLVIAMDNIAATIPDMQIIAQISASSYVVKNMQTIAFISPLEYYKIFDKASLIVSHAGMGTIISALQKGKPIIVMPRRFFFNEHNSDHQVATAQKLAALNYVKVANNEAELSALITNQLNKNSIQVPIIGPHASDQLINSLKKFIKTK